MSEVFREDGHLTKETLHMLVTNNVFSELERLEIAEHLSFCDSCIAEYASILDDSMLLSPIVPPAPGILKRIRERTRRIFASQYATAITAACFAIVFWNIGLFNINWAGNTSILTHLNHEATSFSQKTEQVSGRISKALEQLMSNLKFERGMQANEKK